MSVLFGLVRGILVYYLKNVLSTSLKTNPKRFGSSSRTPKSGLPLHHRSGRRGRRAEEGIAEDEPTNDKTNDKEVSIFKKMELEWTFYAGNDQNTGKHGCHSCRCE